MWQEKKGDECGKTKREMSVTNKMLTSGIKNFQSSTNTSQTHSLHKPLILLSKHAFFEEKDMENGVKIQNFRNQFGE